MRWIGILLLMTAALCRAEDSSLDQSRVTLSYGELRKLIDAAKQSPIPAKPPEPPVPAAVLSATYDMALGAKTATGTARFQLQNFRDQAEVISLIGANAKIERIEPENMLLLVKDARYAVVLGAKQTVPVTLHFTLPLQSTSDIWQGNLAVPVSPLSALRLREIRPEEEVTVEEATPQTADKGESRWQMGAITALRIVRQTRPQPKAAPSPALPQIRVETPSIVRTTSAETRVVRDGSLISTTTWIIAHDNAIHWPLTLPEGSQLLSCRINGQPAAPMSQDERTLVLALPVPVKSGETRVELSYTGKGKSFDPVRGEFTLELPATGLLVESLVWQVTIPAVYETVAIQGNVDFMPGGSGGAIRLTRELGRGEAPTVHVFYQKPETTTKK